MHADPAESLSINDEAAQEATGDLSRVAQDLSRIRFDDRGLVPAIVQEATTRSVLMLAWMDEPALRRTLETRRATYWSRSRQTHWVKGETSGHTQHVREVRLDCDADAVLLVVDQQGPACHTGATTCFDDSPILSQPDAQPAHD